MLAAGEQPPGHLVERVRRRHRRHLARISFAGIAIVAAVVAMVPPARAALLGGGQATRTVSPAPGAPGRAARSAPQRQYYGCDSQTYGDLGPQWRRGSTRAGPLWFVNKGIAPNFRFHNLGRNPESGPPHRHDTGQLNRLDGALGRGKAVLPVPAALQ